VDKFVFRLKETGLKAPSKAALSVYPNPSENVFQVKLPEAGRLSITNLKGQNLYSGYFCELVATIDASGYQKGIYILSFTFDNQNNRIKLIKNWLNLFLRCY
jgi:hypothetical protein